MSATTQLKGKQACLLGSERCQDDNCVHVHVCREDIGPGARRAPLKKGWKERPASGRPVAAASGCQCQVLNVSQHRMRFISFLEVPNFFGCEPHFQRGHRLVQLGRLADADDGSRHALVQ